VTAYSVSGTILTFTEAPAVGANIEIRVLGGTVTSSTTSSDFNPLSFMLSAL
jgi:hypothetical protein